MTNLPRHVAIIMDGNGRWAQNRNLPRLAGHKAGGKAAQEIIRYCIEKEIKALTLFAFGYENWQRPRTEVNSLMGLFSRTLQSQTQVLHKNNVRLRIIGDHTRLDAKLQNSILKAQQLTRDNTGLQLNAAISYSGRWDIIAAVKKIIAEGVKETSITEERFTTFLSLADLPEPDLFIRTSGEKRISNFFLWQLAYTELYFADLLWPDFDRRAFDLALESFAQRQRRFGLTREQLDA